LRTLIATILQALGILGVAAGVYWIVPWAGVVVLGAGLVLFGLSVELGAKSPPPPPPRYPGQPYGPSY
jgi:hypothetical protein